MRKTNHQTVIGSRSKRLTYFANGTRRTVEHVHRPAAMCPTSSVVCRLFQLSKLIIAEQRMHAQGALAIPSKNGFQTHLTREFQTERTCTEREFQHGSRKCS